MKTTSDYRSTTNTECSKSEDLQGASNQGTEKIPTNTEYTESEDLQGGSSQGTQKIQ